MASSYGRRPQDLWSGVKVWCHDVTMSQFAQCHDVTMSWLTITNLIISEAAATFSSRRMEYEECAGPPCSRLEVDAKFKTKTNTSKSMLSFIYPSEIVLIEEFLTDSIISVGWNYYWLFGVVERPITFILSCRNWRLLGNAGWSFNDGSGRICFEDSIKNKKMK